MTPESMSPEELALLCRSLGGRLTQALIEQHIAEGAPTNSDGTLNVIHYAAWLAERWVANGA